jgi:hypothetical protein
VAGDEISGKLAAAGIAPGRVTTEQVKVKSGNGARRLGFHPHHVAR